MNNGADDFNGDDQYQSQPIRLRSNQQREKR